MNDLISKIIIKKKFLCKVKHILKIMNILGLVNIDETQFKKTKSLSSELKGHFTFSKGVSMGASFVIARATSVFSLDEIRSFYRMLNQSFDLPVCVYLLNCSSYSIKAMVKEGIAFYVESKFAYLPFLSILGKNYRDQPIIKTDHISLVCQSLILNAIFSNNRSITVTQGATLTGFSKMAISTAFDELETLQLPVKNEGRQRVFRWDLPWGLLLRNVLPKMTSPVKKEFRLAEPLELKNTYLSGISSLSKKTLLGDNDYQTVAILKDSESLKLLENAEEVPYFEKPGEIITVMGYVIDYGNGCIDPVSAWLSLPSNYPSDARVRYEVGRLFEKAIDGWESSWPLV